MRRARIRVSDILQHLNVSQLGPVSRRPTGEARRVRWRSSHWPRHHARDACEDPGRTQMLHTSYPSWRRPMGLPGLVVCVSADPCTCNRGCAGPAMWTKVPGQRCPGTRRVLKQSSIPVSVDVTRARTLFLLRVTRSPVMPAHRNVRASEDHEVLVDQQAKAQTDSQGQSELFVLG